MDKGIAATFKKLFGGEGQLKSQKAVPGEVAYLDRSENGMNRYV
jgi:hypothetical protein